MSKSLRHQLHVGIVVDNLSTVILGVCFFSFTPCVVVVTFGGIYAPLEFEAVFVINMPHDSLSRFHS